MWVRFVVRGSCERSRRQRGATRRARRSRPDRENTQLKEPIRGRAVVSASALGFARVQAAVRKDLRRLREAVRVEPGRSRDERVAWGGQSGRSPAASKRPGGEDESKNPTSATRARAYLNASNALMSAGEDMSAGTPLLRGAIAPAGRRVAPNRAPSLCRAGGFGLDSLNGRQHRQPTLDRDFDPKLRGQVAENDRDDFVRRAVCGLCIRNPERKRTRLARFARLGAHCLARASAMANVSARGAASAFLPRQMRGGGVRSTRSAARSRRRRERRRERTCARATSASEGARRRIVPRRTRRARAWTDRRPSRRRPGTTTRGQGRWTERTTPPSMARRSRSRRASP